MGIAMGPYALIGGLVADGVALIFTAGIALIFGIAVACVEGLGAWDESLNGGLIEKLKSGGDVLGQLGESLGSFLGGITSGQLKKIAEGLSAFQPAAHTELHAKTWTVAGKSKGLFIVFR